MENRRCDTTTSVTPSASLQAVPAAPASSAGTPNTCQSGNPAKNAAAAEPQAIRPSARQGISQTSEPENLHPSATPAASQTSADSTGIRNNKESAPKRPGRRPAMEARGLHFAYGDNRVLNGMNLMIPRGKITTIMGANGCGKSTLFSLMTKSREAYSGSIFLDGININNLTAKEFARKVAIVQQNNSAPGDMTVRQLVSYGRTPHARFLADNSERDDSVISWAMDVTGIAELGDRELTRLSGGQRQRVWIAMALAQEPEILFLDEPTTFLDVRYQVEILELVRRLNSRMGMTVVMVLHDINQAIYYSDMVAGMHDGVLAVYGRPEEVITQKNIRMLYGIELDVASDGGAPYVLPVKAGSDAQCDIHHEDEALIRKEAEPKQMKMKKENVNIQNPGAANTIARNPGTASTIARNPDTANTMTRNPGTANTMTRNPGTANTMTRNPGTANTIARNPGAANTIARNPNTANTSAQSQQKDTLYSAAPESARSSVHNTEADSESTEKPRRRISKIWIIPGLICLALGSIGIVLPILPTVPFYLAAAFCFAKGSQRLYDWFTNTGVYHKHLESFVNKRAMTVRSKLTIMGTVTLVMGFGFFMMKNVPVGRIILAIVWIAHVIYFAFGIKTERK